MRFGLGVDRDGDGADFNGTEEGVEEFGRVEQQKEYTFLGADTKIAEGVASTVGALQELLVGDVVFAAFDGDVLRATLENVAIHEKRRDVKEWWQRNHVAAVLVAQCGGEPETFLHGRRVDSIRSTRFVARYRREG